MKYSKLLFLLALLGCLAFSFKPAHGQSQKGILSDGRDFYIAQLTPSLSNCSQLKPYQSYWALISSFYDCTVKVTYFNDDGTETTGQSFVLHAKNGIQVALDQPHMNPKDANGMPINPRGQVPEYSSCHIHATRPISVSYYSTGPNSGSLYMALQTGALGKTYVVAAMNADPGLGKATGFRATCPDDSGSSEIGIIAVQDNTTVAITPNGLTRMGNVGVHCGDGATGIPSQFGTTLNRGQVYWVKSTDDDLSNDLSGSIVQANHPVAVIAGCESAFNGETAESVLSDEQRNMSVEQMMPVDFWTDKDFVSMPTAQDPNEDPSDGSAGNQYKIFTYNPGTKLTVSVDKISPYLNVPLDPFSCPPLTFENVEDGINISSNNLPGADTGNKIMVEEYQYRQMSGGSANPSLAPEQMNIIPLSRFRTSYMWQVPDNKYYQRQRRYINVIAQRSQLSHIYLIHNGGAPGALSALPSATGNVSIPGHPELVGRSYEVTGGAYYAYGDSAFAVYQFGDLGYDLDIDLGDNDGDDYFFSYMSTCGLSFGIDGASTPKISADTICGTGWNLKVVDNNPLDRGISTVDLLNDPNGVLKRKPGTDSGYVSQNVHFNPVDLTVIPGDTMLTVAIKVDNPLQDAWAYVWVVNGAGNDTVIYLHYTAPKLTFLSDQGPNDDSINFINSPVGADTCARMVFRNLEQNSGQSYHVSGYHFAQGGLPFRVSSTVPPLPATLAPGDSIVFNVCFNTSQPAQVFNDTLIVETDCPKALAALLGSTKVGQINAADYDFGAVVIGHTACHTVRVWNTGFAPITLTKQWVLDNTANFTFEDSAKLPLILDTGIANGVNLTFCYTPTDTNGDSTQQHWGSDLPEPFTHVNKDFSILKGHGTKPALNWNIPLQYITTECDTPRTFRSILSDSGNATIDVDSLGIIGPDLAEVAIVGHRSPAKKFTLYPYNTSLQNVDTAEWVDVKFTPDLSKPLPGRWADRHDTLVAYDQDSIYPLVVLYLEVHHGEVDLSQTSVDLGITQPGVPTQTKTIVVTNGGDAPLIIQSITIDTPFTIVQPGSLKQWDTIYPGKRDTVLVQATMTWNGSDSGYLNIIGLTPLCSQGSTFLKVASSSIQALAVGHDFSPTYICMSNGDSVSASAGITSIPVKIVSAQIIDDPSDPGGSADFVFSLNNTRSIPNASFTLNAGATEKYGILFVPTLKQAEVADVIFTFDTASNPGVAPWKDTVKITGLGLQEHTVLSVQNPQPGPYTSGTSSVFQVPIQMTMPIAGGADIHSISMDISYKRDIFDPLSTPVVALAPYTVVNSTLDQTNDPAVIHVTIGRTDGQPFNSTAVLANLEFRVMVAKDTITNVVVSNVEFQNSAGSNVCYVLHDTIPASFNPINYCGDDMLRRLVETGQVSLGIRGVHPNPATNTVHIGLDVREDGVPMTIELYNALGQLVRSYGHGTPMPAGLQGMDLDLSDVPPGAYSLRVLTPGYTVGRTLVVQK